MFDWPTTSCLGLDSMRELFMKRVACDWASALISKGPTPFKVEKVCTNPQQISVGHLTSGPSQPIELESWRTEGWPLGRVACLILNAVMLNQCYSDKYMLRDAHSFGDNLRGLYHGGLAFVGLSADYTSKCKAQREGPILAGFLGWGCRGVEGCTLYWRGGQTLIG